MTLWPFSPCFLMCRWRGHLCAFLCFKSTQRSTLWWHNTSFFRWWCTITHRHWDEFFGRLDLHPLPRICQSQMRVYIGLSGFPTKNVYNIILVMTISSLLWFRSHLCDVLGWCCLFNPFLGLKPDITVHLQASKHSGYVFLCWLSWICGGTGNCCLFVATHFSRETWLGMVKTELCLGDLFDPQMLRFL